MPPIAVRRAWPERYTLVALCFCASFICYIDRVNISVASISMQESFGWNDTTKGLVLSSFFVGYLLLQIGAGVLTNRFGGRLVLGCAVLWWSLFTIATPPAAFVSLAVLLAARVALGLGEAATYPATLGMYKIWVPPAERSRSVSILMSGIPLGTLTALLSTGWLVERFGWPSVFYVFGALGFVWAGFWFRLIGDAPQTQPGTSAAERRFLASRPSTGAAPRVPWKALLTKAPTWALIINHFASNWAFYMLLSWLPSYFRDALGVSIANAGIYSAAPWLTMFVMTNAAGWFADALLQRGVSATRVRKLMQCTGLLGSALFLLLARDAASVPEAMVLMCGALGLTAFTWSGFIPNLLEIAPRYADVLTGITNTFGTLPGIIGVAVTGWLVDLTGTYASAFALAAGVNVCGALVWLLFATGEKVVD